MMKTAKLKRLFDLLINGRPQHQPWSLTESRVPVSSYHDLLMWASELTSFDIDTHMQENRLWFGAVLLWLESEVARRHSDDGRLWSVISNGETIRWHPQARDRLFTSDGQPRPLHKDVLIEVANRLELRNAFNVKDTNQWYRLLHLQFGFTHSDAKQRLSAWLSGHSPPVSVDTLLNGVDQGAREFQSLWRSLRNMRLGNVSLESTEHRLKESRWVLPEWCNDLLAAAQASTIETYDEDDETSDSFFTTPRLRWTATEEPWFETELCNLDKLSLTLQSYEVKLQEQVVARLLRQDDGSYINDTEGRIILGDRINVRAQSDLTIMSADGLIVSHSSVCLWNPEKDVNLFRPSDGMITDEQNLKNGQAFDLIATTDLVFDPPAHHSVDLDQGYRIHRFKTGCNTPIVARLDDFVLWDSSEFGMPAQPLPDNVIQVGWTRGSTLDFRDPAQAKLMAPWEVPFKIQIFDKTWRLLGLRWTRADGKLMKWNKPPPYLSLVERDIVKPVILRAILSNGTRIVTIPLKLSVPLIGCFRWTSHGRPSYQGSNRSLSVSDAKRSLWSFYLPPTPDEHGMPFETDPRQTSLMEGDCVRSRLRSRAGVLPVFAGYGASAYVSADPYNSEQHMLDLSSAIFDGGVLGKVKFQGEMAVVEQKEHFELSEDHKLFIWLSTREKPGQLVEVDPKNRVLTDEGCLFLVPEEPWIAALILVFRGERLGSWFDNIRWSSQMLAQKAAEPKLMAALLRCSKAPILHAMGENNHRLKVQAWLCKHWQEVLPVWLLPKGSTIVLEGMTFIVPADEHWLEAVNTLLCDIQPLPDADTILSFIDKLAARLNNESLHQRIGSAVMDLAEVCPLLAARMFRTCLQNYSESLPNGGKDLLLQLIRLYSSNDGKAEELARNYGNRDDAWLRSTVRTLKDLDTSVGLLPSSYCKLAKNSEYRKFALGIWLQEIRNTIRL